MKLCRFDDNRLGVVQTDEVLDVTPALAEIPAQRWPIAQGDPLVLHREQVLAASPHSCRRHRACRWTR